MVALFVIATIVLFVVADAIVAYTRRREAKATKTVPVLRSEGMPAGLFLHPGHAWVGVQSDGSARVGLDELARRLIGAVDSVRFAKIGSKVARGETLLWVKAGELEIPIASPVTGVVQSIQTPDPTAKGNDPAAWLVALQPERLGFEIRMLRVAEDAAAWLRGEFARLSETLHGLRAATAGALPDGGEPADGLLRVVDGEARETLVQGFLARRS